MENIGKLINLPEDAADKKKQIALIIVGILLTLIGKYRYILFVSILEKYASYEHSIRKKLYRVGLMYVATM